MQHLTVTGLTSGRSEDGSDAALRETDGGPLLRADPVAGATHACELQRVPLPRPAGDAERADNERAVTHLGSQAQPSLCSRAVALWLLVALPIAAPAAAPPTDTASAAATPAQFLGQAAGVYKRRFQNGGFLGTGGQLTHYESEDVLEIVPVDEHAAYFRLDLAFFNGHSGRIYGIARYAAPGRLVYDNGESGARRCVLELEWTATAVTTHADYVKTPGCGDYHGVRGTLDRAEFATSQRRVIHYMARLKSSREYTQAWAEYSRQTAPAR